MYSLRGRPAAKPMGNREAIVRYVAKREHIFHAVSSKQSLVFSRPRLFSGLVHPIAKLQGEEPSAAATITPASPNLLGRWPRKVQDSPTR